MTNVYCFYNTVTKDHRVILAHIFGVVAALRHKGCSEKLEICFCLKISLCFQDEILPLVNALGSL